MAQNPSWGDPGSAARKPDVVKRSPCKSPAPRVPHLQTPFLHFVKWPFGVSAELMAAPYRVEAEQMGTTYTHVPTVVSRSYWLSSGP